MKKTKHKKWNCDACDSRQIVEPCMLLKPDRIWKLCQACAEERYSLARIDGGRAWDREHLKERS